MTARPENRAELAAALEAEGVLPEVYDLHGDPGIGEKYVLELVPGGWATYYAERGLRQGESRFETEAEACGSFYEWVRGDATTQRDRPQPGA